MDVALMIIKKILSPGRMFPTILIILDLCAAGEQFFITGDIRKAIYWIAAAVLTVAVTY
jgi:hypothetical protein